MEIKRKKTDAELKAQKNWESKNKEYSNYLKSRSTARSFINKKATKDDLTELQQLINDKLKEI